jgi:hypothetical protein
MHGSGAFLDWTNRERAVCGRRELGEIIVIALGIKAQRP